MVAVTRCLLSVVDCERLAHGRDEPLGSLVQQREVELELAREVLVEHRFGDAGALGDVVHRRRVVALRHEHLPRGIEQLDAARGTRQARAARGGAPARARVGVLGDRHGGEPTRE